MKQSTLDPAAGSAAELIGSLGSTMYVGATLIFVAVMALALWGVFGRRREIDERRWLMIGGLIFPSVTLFALLLYSLAVGKGLETLGSTRGWQLFLDCFGIDAGVRPSRAAPLRVQVVGRQWWWEVRYELPGGQTVVLANELHIPVDQPVQVSLASADVIHSFWVPALAGKVDMIPGRSTRLLLQTGETGTFRGQCAEYCGGQHAWMAFFVIAETQAQFERWLARQAQPVSAPQDPFLRLGYDAFFEGGCPRCHGIRGTPATPTQNGPDLTHVGSRESLAAGMLNNHVGTMAGWIAGAQDVKPGNRMPSMNVYSGVELRALATWLASLE